MDNVNLFDAFGFDFGDLKEEAKEEKKEAKKEAKKAPTKKAEKKTAKKSSAKDTEAETKVDLPLSVKLPYKTLTISEDVKTVRDAFAKVWELGYKEISLLSWGIENAILYCGLGAVLHKAAGNDAIDLSEKKNVEICAGDLRCTYSSEHFEGEEEVSVDMVTEKFVSENPKFTAVEWLYDNQTQVLMPIFAEIPAKTVEKDAAGTGMEALSVYGTKTALSSESEAKISDLPEEIGEGYTYTFGQCDKTLMAYLKVPAKNLPVKVRDEWAVNETKAAHKVAEKYPLPVQLYLYTFGKTMELTSEQFPGKEKITEEDVRSFLKSDIAAFGESNRRFDFLYSKQTNTLSVGISSGTKGSVVVCAGQFVWDDWWDTKEELAGDVEEIVEEEPLLIYKTCWDCGREHAMEVTAEEYLEFDTFFGRKPIQEIFPKMHSLEREFLKTGMCPVCSCKLTGAEVPPTRIKEV